MNPRERLIVIAIGGLVGLWAAYKTVDWLLVSPVRSANVEIERRREEYAAAKKTRERLPEIAKEWQGVARRTYSFDTRDAQNVFQAEIKALAAKHQLRNVNVTPLTPGKLPKSDIATVSVRVTAEGTIDQVSGFLVDFYRMPVLCNIKKLRLAPTKTLGGGEELRISELLVETLVVPQLANVVDAVAVKLRGTTTMPSDPREMPSSLRRGLPSDADYMLLAKRNVFKAYEPPPQFAVTIDNQDLKDVNVQISHSWKGQAGTPQPAATVAGKSRKDMPPVAGDRVEVTVKYADGKTFGPTALTWAEGKPAVVTVPAHTPPPPPESFQYSIRNDGEEPVELEIVVTKDGKATTWPIMKFPKKTGPTAQPSPLPEIKGQTLMLTGIYADGTRALPGTYQVATQNTGTHVIPPKPKVPDKPLPVVNVNLPPPNPDLQVTGLLSYPESQELIALNMKTKKREVIAKGAPIDGGKLVMVEPLGGVAQIGGVYFLYPLGRKFPERVQLDALDESEIPTAIARWNQQ